jgi:uncharacterized protein with von Willebrand factor type A (vWA) domain
VSWRYGEWHGGPDPLASPFTDREALDELGDTVLAGASPREALEQLLRRGPAGRGGLDDLARRVRDRQRLARRRGRLDGTLQEARRLLAQALDAERRALFADPSDAARLKETELDEVPADPARAVQRLADYQWQSPEGRDAYRQIRDLLRREVLDAQFRGLQQALHQPDRQAMKRIRGMLGELNDLLDADARGEDVTERFERFLDRHGELFPERPATLDELVDSLARRAAAAARLLASLSPEQRDELAGLIAAALDDAGLATEMARLSDALRARRPDLDWAGAQRTRGGTPLGLGDATSALEELADLDELADALAQDYPGASLDDIDEDAVARALGRTAVDDLAELRRIERELERQGYLRREHGEWQLTPRAVRRLGDTALRRVFAAIDPTGRGDHDTRDAGAGGEPTGSARAWQFGDEQPLDVVRTVRNAVLRQAADGHRPGRPLRLAAEDFDVVQTERRGGAAVALLVDLSYSMALRGTWGVAKSTALALNTLVATRYPQDAVAIIGFSNYARPLNLLQLTELSWDMVQGTNLQHALMLAGRHLARHPDAEPVVLVVTDGEPTAHLLPDGSAFFDWPTDPRTAELTMAEVDRLTRRGATINVFMLNDEPRLVRFVNAVARRNGGRVFAPDPQRLGEYVVADYLRARRGRRAG